MTALVSLLSFVIICQFVVIVILMGGRDEGKGEISSRSQKYHLNEAAVTLSLQNSMADRNFMETNLTSVSKLSPEIFEGVAVTTFLGAPKWFQNRYTMMVNQMVSVLDAERGTEKGSKRWIVQIFYLPKDRMSMEGIAYPGIQKLVKRGHVILTPIPSEYSKLKKKVLMLQPWLWREMLAERVLIFGGNVIICGNSQADIKDYYKFDYIGAPWPVFKGFGGDGGLSLRNRTVMLAILEDINQTKDFTGKKNPYTGLEYEDQFFVKGAQNLQKQNFPITLASSEDTKRFVMSGIAGQDPGSPLTLGASGTLPNLNDTARQQFLDFCPELKMLYPSMHSPHCFGAEPNPLGCFRYLCELGGLKCRNWVGDRKGKEGKGQEGGGGGGGEVVSWKELRKSDGKEVTMSIKIELTTP